MNNRLRTSRHRIWSSFYIDSDCLLKTIRIFQCSKFGFYINRDSDFISSEIRIIMFFGFGFYAV